jgi:isoquinoline 1-oxidoreductase subunit beta
VPEFASEASQLTDGDAPRGLARRRFLTFLVAAPALTVAARVGAEVLTPAKADAVVPSPPQPADVADFGDVMTALTRADTDLFVLQVTPDNRIRFEVPRAEVGQGITTALAMIVAEELDARLADVDVPLSDARQDLGAAQSTGGSTSVRSLWDPVRQLAAEARARLVTAAAQEWNVPPTTLSTHDTAVWAPDGRWATYGSLTAAASRVLVPAVSSDPKPAAAYGVIGQPTGRVDALDIVTGKARYALDVAVPGALPTVVARPPTINGTVLSYDATAAKSMPGVVAITQIPTGVAVTAQTFDQALKAAAAVVISWGAGSVDGVSDADITAKLTSAIAPFAVPPLLTQYVDGTFDFAFVNHAPMEVGSAVADVRSTSAEVWLATKSPTSAQSAVAGAVGLQTGQVTVHVVRGGGSFGRRIYSDPAVEAAQVSQAIGRPVKLMWTRNDDMRHGRMRPRSHHQIRASYTGTNVVSYEHRMASVAVDFTGSGTGQALVDAGYGSPTVGTGYFQLSEACPYNFGAVTETLAEVPYELPTGTWRSVYSAQARTAEEIMVDELARKMGKDPVAFRLEFLKTDAERAVLNKVAAAGSWRRTMAPRTAQGVGFHAEYRSLVGCLVEIDCTTATPRVTKAVVAVDVGLPVNPKGVQAQAIGGVIDGISTILFAGNHLDNGAFREGSYKDFLYARQGHAPLSCDVYVMPATQPSPGGAGELIVPAAAAAVANAYARATGAKPRSFPIAF